MSLRLTDRLHARTPSLRDHQTEPGGGSAHLLVWGELPQWLVVDDELDSLLHQFDGRRTLKKVLERHARRWQKSKSEVQREGLPVVADLLKRSILTAGTPRAVRREDPLGLANITVNLTNRCNLRCPWCYNAQREQQEMPIEALMAALEAGRARYDAGASLIILGGEPLIDLPRLFGALDRGQEIFAPAPMISTNGTLLRAPVVAELASRRVEVQVSVDGPDAERHDAVRGKGVFGKAIAGIERLVAAGVPTIMSMVYTSKSIADFEAYLELAERLGADEARFIPLRLVGGALDDPSARPDQHVAFEQLLEILERRPELGPLLARDYFSIVSTIFRFAAGRTSCGIGRKVVFVDADGAVYPCPNHVSPLYRAGQLQERSLIDIVESSAVMRSVREHYQVDRYAECRSCTFRHWCAGDCRGEVLALGGDAAAPSPHCQELQQLYRRILWLLARGDERLGTQRELADGQRAADTFL